jgi:hypothetical protein
LSKDDPSRADERTGHQAEPLRYDDQRATPAAESGLSSHPTEPITGLPYTPAKDADAAKRLEEHESVAQAAPSEDFLQDRRPTEATTGLPYDPAKDPEAAKRMSETGKHDSNLETSSGRGSDSQLTGEPESPTGKRGFRQKLKEKITGHKEEDTHDHSDHSVLHKKPHQMPEEVRSSLERTSQEGRN